MRASAARCDDPLLASDSIARQIASITRTLAAHSAIIVLPVERLRMQCERQASPARTHSAAA
jgi:hypothetical protein